MNRFNLTIPVYLLFAAALLMWTFSWMEIANSTEGWDLRGTIHQAQADGSKPATIIEHDVDPGDLYFKPGEGVKAGAACFVAPGMDEEDAANVESIVTKAFIVYDQKYYDAMFKNPGDTGCAKAISMGKRFFPGKMKRMVVRTFNGDYCSEVWEAEFDLPGAEVPIRGFTWGPCKRSEIDRMLKEHPSTKS
jgi:hypothetical protein